MATKGKTQRSKTVRKKPSKSAAGKATATMGKSRVEGKSKKAKPVSQEERRRLIATAAYKRAEAREFRDMDQVGDWLAAEREVDERLARGASI